MHLETVAHVLEPAWARAQGNPGSRHLGLIMRGALGPRIRRVYEVYHVPASNTAAGMVLLENLSR